MESEASPEPCSTPKLSLFSLPSQVPEPAGMLTPPLRTKVSVPFQWEEAPGKPFTSTTITTSLARCLELPPRLLSEVKMTDMPSPSTVFDGPYVTRSASHSTVFARERLTSFEDMGSMSKRREGSRGSGYFGTWGRKSCRRNTRVCEDSCGISPCSSSLGGAGAGAGARKSSLRNIRVCEDNCGISSRSSSIAGDASSGVDTKDKIRRIRRTGSFFNLSSSRSHTHIWASIYGSFKHVVPHPWRRSRKIKKDELSI